MSKHSAVAIGGPADGKIIDSDHYFITIPDGLGGAYEYALRSVCGSYYWASQLEDTGKLIDSMLERYSQFRDFASGKTLEVINLQNDRIQELLTADAGAKAREQNLREEMEANELLHMDFVRSVLQAVGVSITKSVHRAEDEALAYVRSTHEIARAGSDTINEVRRLCEMSGFGDRGSTTEGLVVQLTAAFERTRASLEDVKVRHNETIDAVRAELKSTGHKHEGAPIDHLVDMAIDRERDRHGQSLIMIASSLGISFAVGSNYEQMTDYIINLLRLRNEKKLVAMQEKPKMDSALGYSDSAPKLSLEQRVARIEHRLSRIDRAATI